MVILVRVTANIRRNVSFEKGFMINLVFYVPTNDENWLKKNFYIFLKSYVYFVIFIIFFHIKKVFDIYYSWQQIHSHPSDEYFKQNVNYTWWIWKSDSLTTSPSMIGIRLKYTSACILYTYLHYAYSLKWNAI